MSHVINRPTVQCEFKGTLPHPTYRVNVNVAEPGYEDCLWFLIVTHLYVRIVSVHRSHFDALCSQTQGLRRWCDALWPRGCGDGVMHSVSVPSPPAHQRKLRLHPQSQWNSSSVLPLSGTSTQQISPFLLWQTLFFHNSSQFRNPVKQIVCCLIKNTLQISPLFFFFQTALTPPRHHAAKSITQAGLGAADGCCWHGANVSSE